MRPLRRVVESVQLCQPNRAMAVFDVAEDPAGTDGGQLLIITDRHTAATANNELNGGVQGERVRHPSLIDQHQRRGADTETHSGGSPFRYWRVQVSLASVSLGTGVIVQLRSS